MSNVEQADATAKAEEAPTVRLSSHMAILPEVVKERVTVLQDIQKKHDELEAKFHEERAALIAKYQKLYEPLYTRRADIVNGSEEVAKETPPADALAEVPRKGVPDFWLTALKTNEILAMQITEKDEVALKYLKDLKSFYIENPKGFKLEFHFDENPFFTNTVLTKEYHMVDEDEPILERATGTKIEWKPGKDLSKKLMKKKPKKGSKDAAPQTKLQECDTFFNFFNPPQIPEDDDDLDQDEAEELQDLMEQDYDVGATIRDKIIPHAVSWYTGEALQGEEIDDESDGEEDEEDEDEEDDDEEEDDEDDEDEDEEPEQKPKVVATIPKSEESQQQ